MAKSKRQVELEKKNEDKPWTSNYPPLQEWLHKLDARCNWQIPLGGDPEDPNAYVEAYQAPGCIEFIVVVYSHRHGWAIYTQSHDTKIDGTLAEAEQRIRRPQQ